MTAGMIYSCKWNHLGRAIGWDMLLFLRTETLVGCHGNIHTNYRFYDITSGEERLLDKGLIKHCKELNLEEI